jgi:DNA processing protein
MEHAVAEGVSIIPYDDPEYPQPLLHSFDPPAVLYVRGRLTKEDWVAVGIVGTRNMSKYGRDKAVELAAALALGGYTIVSGLARGVDTFAHIGALNARGRTVGVLGCGFDHMYPEENRDLALEMTRSGAVITEFSMATPPSKDTFPVRNRIIAGMVLGLLVIEAPLRSGSLITARLANEIGRTVFAIPGRMDDARSEGCNKLIRDGAVMVTTVDDIFTELNPSLPLPNLPRREDRAPTRRGAETGGKTATQAKTEKTGAKPVPEQPHPPPALPAPPAGPPLQTRLPKLSPEQKQVLDQVSPDWRTADEIIAAAGLPSGKTTATLSLLKLMRLIEQGSGQSYRKR